MGHPRKYAILPEGTGWRQDWQHASAMGRSQSNEIHQAIEDFVYLEALNGARLSNMLEVRCFARRL